MTTVCRWFVYVLAAGLAPGVVHGKGDSPVAGSYLTTPEILVRSDGRSQSAERGLFFVPENRKRENSRIIPVHFLRFPALQGAEGRPPVFLLPGGPGTDWDFADKSTFDAVKRLRRTRDVVYVSQRGNPRAPHLVPDLAITIGQIPLDQAGSPARDRELLREALLEAQETWTGRGVDLSGYDILNVVDDVYELRAALGYERIVLRGCSFGSQWSFAYLKRWPGTVDRALLSGVEPLDYAYDSPDWLWASMERLAKAAEADAKLSAYIPKGGLMQALKEVLERLEEKPVRVAIATPSGSRHELTVGAHDLRQVLRSSYGPSRRGRYENWPRYILELHSGDYRYLAAQQWENRSRRIPRPMIGLLIDNSLGITADRDSKLSREAAAHWLGDINASYKATRELTATSAVDDDFRADWEIDVPVLLVNGDLDWSTPLENAKHARRFLSKGHLISVLGAGHCPIGEELAKLLPDVAEQIRKFIDADFVEGSPAGFFETLPQKISLPPFQFNLPVGPSLYDQWLKGQAAQ